MDDPTKDSIPRSAVEYICRKETVSTNPDDFAHSEMFIRYLDHDAISSFGRWQWANGFNTALVAVKCGLDKIPTIEPEIVRCKDCKHRMPYDWMFSEVWQSQNMDDYSDDEIGCEYCDSNMTADDFCSRAERREEGDE